MVALASGMKDVISFALGEPDYNTPEHIKKALIKALEQGYTHYTSTTGLPELRIAIAEKLARENGIKYDPENEVVVTTGATEAAFSSVMSVIDPDDEVIVTNPNFVFYAPTVMLASGTPVYVPAIENNDFRPIPSEIEDAVTPKTKMIWINSPNNPTGTVLSKEDLEHLARIARKYDLLVISDEVYEKFVYDDSRHFSIASLPEMKERTITINALSKTYAMTGLRVGYVAADQRIIDRIHLVHMHICTHPSTLEQKAGVTALEGSQESVVEMVREFEKRRNFMVGRLNEIDGISCVKPHGAFYVFPNISDTSKSSMEFAEYLLRRGRVNTVPGIAFGTLGEGYLRLSFAASMKLIEEGMNRIEKTMKAPD
jgi:aminotransferase